MLWWMKPVGGGPARLWRDALLVALAYLLVSSVYFSLADRFLGTPTDPRRLHAEKGWAFVGVTTLALFALLWHSSVRLWRRTREEAELLMADQRRQAELRGRLDEVKAQLRLLLDGTPSFFFYVHDAEGLVTYVSPTVEQITGRPVEQWLGQSHWFVTEDPVNEEARQATCRHLDGQLDSRPTLVEVRHADGHPVLLEVYEHGRFEGGRLTGLQGIAVDVTERVRAERAVADSERRYRTLAEASRDFIFIIGRDGRLEYVNGVSATAFGKEPSAMVGQPVAGLFPQGSLEVVQQNIARVFAGGEPLNVEEQLHIGDRELWLNSWLVPMRDDGGEVKAVLGVSRDVTERRQAAAVEAAVRKIAEAAISARSPDELFPALHAVVVELMPAENLYIALHDPDADLVSFAYWVDEKDPCPEPRRGGRGLTEYVIRTGRPVLASPRVFEELYDTGEVDTFGSVSLDWLGVPLRFHDRTIGVLAVQTYTERLRYGDREMQILEFVSTQIAMAIERTRAEAALRESEERYRRLVELSPDGIAIHAEGRLTFVNSQGARMLGVESEEGALGRPVLEFIHPDDRPFVGDRVRRGLELRETQPPLEERFLRADGSILHVEVAAAPFQYLGKAATLVVFRDVSERLRASEQLRQAQKMEAVGQLAGGVAHDFNNLLQAVLAAIQVLRAEPDDRARSAHTLDELEAHVRRGASMTRQLLLFSRRDVTRGEPLDLDGVVAGTAELLRRLVPERVRMQLALGGVPLPVDADRGQLEQVLVNLVLNACDAMPQGGDLVLRTGQLEGRVWLEVGDTGIGVPEALRGRVFEPFFTTKPAGKGSGLGLSVVHGIVAAHGGEVEVRGREGSGVVFRVILPRGKQPEPSGAESEEQTPIHRGRGQRVLLVEDEPATREGLAEVLQLLGYRVTAVESAEEALATPAEPAYDALLTDLALPGLGGAELGTDLLQRWPGLAVIVMSGYAAEAEVRRAAAEGRLRFLQKPFPMGVLAEELSALLDRGPATTA